MEMQSCQRFKGDLLREGHDKILALFRNKDDVHEHDGIHQKQGGQTINL